MKIGSRIVYDQDGEIVTFFGEMTGNEPPRKEIMELSYIDLEYAAIDYNLYRIVRVDPKTKLPVLERIHPELTPEEKMRELEDQILLLANENTGGIL